MDVNKFKTEDFNRYKKLKEDYIESLDSSGWGDDIVKKHTENIEMFLFDFLLAENVTEVGEGIGLLDSYVVEFLKNKYSKIPLHVLIGNITTLEKFYLFLEERQDLPPGSCDRLFEEVKAKKDDWMIWVNNVLPVAEDSHRTGRLFQLVKEYTEIAPWNWLRETDVFAVGFSDEEEDFFCAVLGDGGKSFGLAIYRGCDELNSPLNVMENPMGFTDYLRLDLLNRDEIKPVDYEHIKKSGVTFRGKGRWPSFTLYNSEHLPVYPGGDELRLMERILSVINPFVESIRHKPQGIPLLPKGKILLRRYDKLNNFFSEHAISMEEYFVKNPNLVNIPITYDDLMIKRAQRKGKKSKSTWEVDISIMPKSMTFDGKSVFPAMLMVVDKGSMMILKAEIVDPDFMEELQEAFLEAIEELKTIPRKVEILHKRNNFYLYDLLERLSIDVEKVKSLELIPRMKEKFSHIMVDEDFWD